MVQLSPIMTRFLSPKYSQWISHSSHLMLSYGVSIVSSNLKLSFSCLRPLAMHGITIRDHFVNAPSQWEMMLQCNIISHWLGSFTKWSLTMDVISMEVKKVVTISIDPNHSRTWLCLRCLRLQTGGCMACHPGDHHWDYYPGTLSFSQITATH